MADARRIIVIFVIAILFAIFVQVAIEAFYPSPKYQDYCKEQAQPREIPYKDPQSCPELTIPEDFKCASEKGGIQYKYDLKGCPTEIYCETCNILFDNAQQKYNLMIFIISAVAGLIALIVGLYLPQHKNPINEWIGSGFLLGGILTIFVGTIRYFGQMGRYIRPIVILFELILIIYLAYKKLGKKK